MSEYTRHICCTVPESLRKEWKRRNRKDGTDPDVILRSLIEGYLEEAKRKPRRLSWLKKRRLP